MKKIILITCSLFLYIKGSTQNLVIDYGFENSYDKNKSFASNITQFNGWVVKQGSPFVNSFAVDLLLSNDSSIINKGIVFCVFDVRGEIKNNVYNFESDILTSKLAQKTKKNNLYILGFDLSVTTLYTDININKFGIKLSKSSKKDNKVSKNNSLILQTILSNPDWQRFECTILADDEYDQIEIGVFEKPENLNYIEVNPDNMNTKKLNGYNVVRFKIDNVTLKKI